MWNLFPPIYNLEYIHNWHITYIWFLFLSGIRPTFHISLPIKHSTKQPQSSILVVTPVNILIVMTNNLLLYIVFALPPVDVVPLIPPCNEQGNIAVYPAWTCITIVYFGLALCRQKHSNPAVSHAKAFLNFIRRALGWYFNRYLPYPFSLHVISEGRYP